MREEISTFRSLVELGIENGWIIPPNDHSSGQKRTEIKRMLEERKLSLLQIAEKSGATMRYVQRIAAE